MVILRIALTLTDPEYPTLNVINFQNFSDQKFHCTRFVGFEIRTGLSDCPKAHKLNEYFIFTFWFRARK